MGRLTITQATDMIALAEEVASFIHLSPPSILATVQVDKQQYLFTLTGAPPQYILKIQTIVSTLGQMVAVHNSRYGAPQQITFLSEDFLTNNFPSETVTVTHSALALYNLLNEVINNETFLAKTLLIDDQDKPFQYGNWARGGLEYLLDIFPKIKPSHCLPLTRLQLLIVPKSVNIILGLKDLIIRNCLTQLKTLELPYSSRYQPHTHKEWLCLIDKEILQLSEVYYRGLGKDSNNRFQFLEHLRLTLWLELHSLDVIRACYSQLHTLAIDCVMPMAKEEDQLNYEISESIEAIDDKKTIQPLLIYTDNAGPLEISRKALLGLDRIIEEYKDNQLECLEIYYWYPDNPSPSFACEKLQLYIANEWLPKLNSIVMRPAIDQPLLDGLLIDEEMVMDSSALLLTLITKQTPIKTLQLLLPEKAGYQAWLTYMTEGGFPQLTHLSYRLPDQLKGEEKGEYHRRIERALTDIRDTVRSNSQFEACILEGDIPSQLAYLVRQIDTLLLTRRSHILG
jgi:hypothetical protein